MAVMKSAKKTAGVRKSASKSKIVSLAAQKKYYSNYSPDKAANKKLGSKDAPVQPPVTVSQTLYWGPSTLKGCGNGVFTAKTIKKGDVVEIAPCLVDADVNWHPNASCVHEDYTICYEPKYPHWKKNTYRLNVKKEKYEPFAENKQIRKFSCLMLGYGSLYNHSESPNAEVEWGANNTVIFRAMKEIPAHSECFISYGYEWWTDRKRYFAMEK